MGARLNEGKEVQRPQTVDGATLPIRAGSGWPRFSANASRHASAASETLAGSRNWTASDLAALLADFLKREHASLAACHGQNVESDWIPLARALAIRLSEAPGMSLAASPLKSRFLLREQIGAWLVATALEPDAASAVHIALPESWNTQKVLAYLFRHEIAPMHFVTAALRTHSMPLSATTAAIIEDEKRVIG